MAHGVTFHLLLMVAVCLATTARAQWRRGGATFYGGSDDSGTMGGEVELATSLAVAEPTRVQAPFDAGGACGYGDMYSTGYGKDTAALSLTLFNGGAACGECYQIQCDYENNRQWCKRGVMVTVTATNLCPPDYSKPNNKGGWCNPPRQHFDMAQSAWEKIGTYPGGIVPVLFQRVPCHRSGGVRFTINGHNYFELVLITNVAGPGSLKTVQIKGSKTEWVTMSRNWGAHWHANNYLNGQSISFHVTATNGRTIEFHEVMPGNWRFGQTFTNDANFN